MLPLEDITLGQLFRRTCAAYPDRPALQHRSHVLTYSELDEAVSMTARRLLGWGVRKGMHIGVRAEAEAGTVICMHALTLIGAVVTMLNTSLTEEEAWTLLERTDCAGLLIGDGYKNVNYVSDSVTMSGKMPLDIRYIGVSGISGSFKKLSDEEPASIGDLAAAEAAVKPEDTAYILFTSGTSSNPKAVMTSHYGRANSGIQQASDMHATCEDRFCVAMPIFHCFCLSVNVMAALAVGACLYLPESRHTSDLLQGISEGRCTVLSSVPALFHAMLSRSDFDHWDLSTLRVGFIGGSLYPPELFKEINDKFGFTLMSSLGQTEATAGITTSYIDDDIEVRSTTVGHMMDHVEGCTKDGELCVRGYVVMQGYYNSHIDMSEVIDGDGWLHTGDMGYFDEKGNLHLTGRRKELVIRGGENISPAEIEAVFYGNEVFENVKVLGVPDAHYGEELCLCLQLKPGQKYDETGLREFMRSRLADFKIPKYILELEQFPLSQTGKILTGPLKEIVLSRLGLNG